MGNPAIDPRAPQKGESAAELAGKFPGSTLGPTLATPVALADGGKDRNIPPQTLAFMAQRAPAKDVEVVRGASHVVMVSHPEAVARSIEKAASGY